MRYYGLVAAATKKAQEDIEFKKGTTVEEALKMLVEKYGKEFERGLFVESAFADNKIITPNLLLNKSRIQWAQDFPLGIKTPLKDGDVLWMGLIIGGGEKNILGLFTSIR
jgi:molybdopterin converting factor small subunit